MAVSGELLECGAVVGGYRIDELISRGGMGLVYRATNVALDRSYALKVLAPELARDVKFQERFKREMRIAASLHHPNVVAIQARISPNRDRLLLVSPPTSSRTTWIHGQKDGAPPPSQALPHTTCNGDEFAAELAVGFHLLVRELAASESCEVVKAIGDAVMVRAAWVADAVRLAQRIHACGEELGYPPLRAGIDTGPAVPKDGDWYGTTVNQAARVAEAADPGELLLTERARAALTPSRDVRIVARGVRALKGLPEALLQAADAGTPDSRCKRRGRVRHPHRTAPDRRGAALAPAPATVVAARPVAA